MSEQILSDPPTTAPAPPLLLRPLLLPTKAALVPGDPTRFHALVMKSKGESSTLYGTCRLEINRCGTGQMAKGLVI